MNDDIPGDDLPKGMKGGKALRFALNAAGGLIPFAGGFLSASAGAWSESEQEKVNSFFEHWRKMIQDDIAEKAQTILEIMARLDMNDEKVSERVTSPEYQSLVRKAFRDWAGAESEEKRKFIRNILTNAADVSLTSDDVVRMFLQWIEIYSELHFAVIGAIYNSAGITRFQIWSKVGRARVKENSAEADLFKLLIRDLSTGSIIRQHREVNNQGQYLKTKAVTRPSGLPASTIVESAFDNTKGYELTSLGDQFVHYAMTDLPVKIGFSSTDASPAEEVEPREDPLNRAETTQSSSPHTTPAGTISHA